jgi:acetyltransferase-like isoleucine patch superfamily enzyme
LQIFKLLSNVLYRIYLSNSNLYLSYLKRKGVRIGQGTAFFGHVTIDSTRPCLLEIGKNCILTDGVVVLTHGYDWAVLREKYHEVVSSSGKVVLGDNIFVGNNTIILKGVRIGENCIIGAGSVVTHDIPPDSVAAGNPCKVIMSLDEYFLKRKALHIDEAKKYAYELFLKTDRPPKLEDFWEEFPIFLQRNANWGKLPVRSQLGSAYATFMASKPVFDSFDDFLIASGIPKDKIINSH